jgi:ABC-type uncharacterized transport system YnjBCD substrate-binding protein
MNDNLIDGVAFDGWAKTSSYLKELNTFIEYYPAGTTATMKEFGEAHKRTSEATEHCRPIAGHPRRSRGIAQRWLSSIKSAFVMNIVVAGLQSGQRLFQKR